MSRSKQTISYNSSYLHERFSNLFSGLNVKENNEYIMIEGINGREIAHRITKLWKTSAIANHLFSKVTGRQLIFRKFFAVEVVYVLNELMDDRYLYSGTKAMAKKALELMKTETWLRNLYKDLESKLDYSQISRFKKTPLETQKEYLDLYDRNTQLYGLNGFLLSAAAGAGKEQPLYSKIKVPGGWKLMGEMKLGDTVTAWDGTPSKVIGVFPQGMKPVYTLTFTDGRKAECGAEHLWRVYLEGKRQENRVVTRTKHPHIVNTIELIKLLNSTNKNISKRIHIDLPESDKLAPDIDLPIDPYVLGVLIGDGGLSAGSVHLSTSDQYIIDKVSSKIPDSLEIKQRSEYEFLITRKASSGPNEMKDMLDSLGLMGKLSLHKFIPRQYLNGSHLQRQELLHGLMDTDGNASAKGSGINFSTSSEQLALDVQYLARSLGHIAKITSRIPRYTHNGEKKDGQRAYRVWLRCKSPSDAFSLPRQLERAPDSNQYSKGLKLRLETIELTGYEECQCISIDHPDHLYITDDFTVTHNTITSLMAMACLKKDLVIVTCLKNNVIEPWVKTLETEFKKPVKFWSTLTDKTLEHVDYDYIVVHYEALNKLEEFIPDLKKKNIGIILDESHNFNDIKSERTQRFVKLVKDSGASDIIPMSGTPVKAMATEMTPMLKSIDPLFVDDVEERFKKIFGVSTARANDIMRNRVGLMSYRTEKTTEEYGEIEDIEYKVVLPDADRYTLPTIKLEMTAFVRERLEYYKKNFSIYEEKYIKGLTEFERTILKDSVQYAYEEYKDNIKQIRKTTNLFDVRDIITSTNEFEKNHIAPVLKGPTLHDWRSAKSVVKYVGLKVRGEALGRLLGRRRAECHVAMIEHAQLDTFVEAAKKKTLIFTSYVDVVSEVKKYFERSVFKNRYSPMTVTAETTKMLKQMLGRLEKDPKANPMIATYDSLSTGVPVTAASTVILFNQPFRSYEREQAIARAWRRGQDTPVTVVNVILDTGDIPNISTRSLDIMEWSKEQVEQITGVKLSGTSNNPSVGLEEFIDPEELEFMKEKNLDKSNKDLYSDVLSVLDKKPVTTPSNSMKLNDIFASQIDPILADFDISLTDIKPATTPSNEETSEDNIVDSGMIDVEALAAEVIPSLEGIFDSAVSSIKKIFEFIGLKDIDKERVNPFVPSRELTRVLKAKDYSELADLFVTRPEGLNVTYLHFSKEMEKQFRELSQFFNNTLKPVNQYLASVASDPEQLASIRPGEFNIYIKKYNLDSMKASYASNFKDGNLTRAYYHQVIDNNDDWLKLQRSVTDTQKEYLKLSPKDIETSVNISYEILEDIIRQLKADTNLLRVSKVQLKDITTLAFTLAEVIEYYSGLLYVWRVFNQSLKETDKQISSI